MCIYTLYYYSHFSTFGRSTYYRIILLRTACEAGYLAKHSFMILLQTHGKTGRSYTGNRRLPLPLLWLTISKTEYSNNFFRTSRLGWPPAPSREVDACSYGALMDISTLAKVLIGAEPCHPVEGMACKVLSWEIRDRIFVYKSKRKCPWKILH